VRVTAGSQISNLGKGMGGRTGKDGGKERK